MSVEVVDELRADLGESPVWDDRHGQLWWVDAVVGHVHRRDINTGVKMQVDLGRRLGGLALAEDELVVMADRDVIALPRDPGAAASSRTLHRTDAPLHDCGVAPDGTVWVGTLSMDTNAPCGGLLQIGTSGVSRVRLVEGFRMPNGISWTSEGTAMHVVDSLLHTVFRSRFEDGEEVQREPWIVGTPTDGLPDGVCADEEGGLWVALWGTGRVARYDVNGRLTRTIEIPAKYATSCCAGGPGLRQLFITSARYDSGREETEAGALFVAEIDVPGLPVPTAKPGGPDR